MHSDPQPRVRKTEDHLTLQRTIELLLTVGAGPPLRAFIAFVEPDLLPDRGVQVRKVAGRDSLALPCQGPGGNVWPAVIPTSPHGEWEKGALHLQKSKWEKRKGN